MKVMCELCDAVQAFWIIFQSSLQILQPKVKCDQICQTWDWKETEDTENYNLLHHTRTKTSCPQSSGWTTYLTTARHLQCDQYSRIYPRWCRAILCIFPWGCIKQRSKHSVTHAGGHIVLSVIKLCFPTVTLTGYRFWLEYTIWYDTCTQAEEFNQCWLPDSSLED